MTVKVQTPVSDLRSRIFKYFVPNAINDLPGRAGPASSGVAYHECSDLRRHPGEQVLLVQIKPRAKCNDPCPIADELPDDYHMVAVMPIWLRAFLLNPATHVLDAVAC
jgi:hypothetical protein